MDESGVIAYSVLQICNINDLFHLEAKLPIGHITTI